MIEVGTFEATRRMLAEVCGRYPAPRLLDIGCGTGGLLVSLAPTVHSAVGIDVSPDAVAEAHRRAAGLDGLEFRGLAAERLADGDLGTFDVIAFVGSLEHMADPQAALQAARAHAHPGSRIVVVAISPAAPHAAISRGLLRWSRNPVVAHLGAAGVARLAARAGLEAAEIRPLCRGSRKPGQARALGGLLAAYDRLGGPTCAVVLKPSVSIFADC